jgi:3-hydroxyanthranilate 3,4-dioxygenase
MIQTLVPYDVKRWVEDNKHLYTPPYKTNRVVIHQKEFIVMIVHGPNTRLDFHIEPADEFFYQIHGDIELHLKPQDGRREVIKLREGEMFLCPGDLAHSPRRPENTWGLVIERKRRTDENEMFVWFCEKCDEQVLSRTVVQGDIGRQVSEVYEAFNVNPTTRTCKSCGYVFPTTPMAERLGFLQAK